MSQLNTVTSEYRPEQFIRVGGFLLSTLHKTSSCAKNGYLSISSPVKDLAVHSAQGLIGSEFECHVWNILHQSWQVACEQAPDTCVTSSASMFSLLGISSGRLNPPRINRYDARPTLSEDGYHFCPSIQICFRPISYIRMPSLPSVLIQIE